MSKINDDMSRDQITAFYEKSQDENKKRPGVSGTKVRVLKAALRCFSQYGYESTTTRMIAKEADVNLSAISFHFGTKEKLYEDCMRYVGDIIGGYYRTRTSEVEKDFADGTMTKEKALSHLEKLINVQIKMTFSKNNIEEKEIVYQDQRASAGDHSLQKTVYYSIEHTIAKLIQFVSGVSEDEATIASRHINGGIVAFGEHQDLMEPYLQRSFEDPEALKLAQQMILEDSMAIVRNLIEKNKA